MEIKVMSENLKYKNMEFFYKNFKEMKEIHTKMFLSQYTGGYSPKLIPLTCRRGQQKNPINTRKTAKTPKLLKPNVRY